MRAEINLPVKAAERDARVLVIGGAGGCVLFRSGFWATAAMPVPTERTLRDEYVPDAQKRSLIAKFDDLCRAWCWRVRTLRWRRT
jgi:hypothetical protein